MTESNMSSEVSEGLRSMTLETNIVTLDSDRSMNSCRPKSGSKLVESPAEKRSQGQANSAHRGRDRGNSIWTQPSFNGIACRLVLFFDFERPPQLSLGPLMEDTWHESDAMNDSDLRCQRSFLKLPYCRAQNQSPNVRSVKGNVMACVVRRFGYR